MTRLTDYDTTGNQVSQDHNAVKDFHLEISNFQDPKSC